MPRLIEIQDAEALPALTVNVGDVLWFTASGGRVHQDAVAVLQVLGPFQQGLVGPAGAIVSPAGPPTAIFFLARSPGRAAIEVITGDPWHGPRQNTLQVTVER